MNSRVKKSFLALAGLAIASSFSSCVVVDPGYGAASYSYNYTSPSYYNSRSYCPPARTYCAPVVETYCPPVPYCPPSYGGHHGYQSRRHYGYDSHCSY